MRLKASLVSSQYAIVEWRPPKILADTVKTYHLNFRKLGSGDEYLVIEKVKQSTFLNSRIKFLEKLKNYNFKKSILIKLQTKAQ